jgi:hypothetical protein
LIDDLSRPALFLVGQAHAPPKPERNKARQTLGLRQPRLFGRAKDPAPDARAPPHSEVLSVRSAHPDGPTEC